MKKSFDPEDGMKQSPVPAFEVQRTSSPTDDATREAAIRAPKMGSVFTDHMVTVSFSEEKGWHDARVGARRPLELDPAAGVLHYGQEIFEGMKAYRTPSGDVVTFRPAENARRMRESARRLCMPEIPEAFFLKALEAFIAVDHPWVPPGKDHSLYLRPFMIATEPLMGVRPAKEYKFLIIATPSGAYFNKSCVTIWVTDTYSRAAMGGTGAAKCGGNYAAGLLAQQEAAEHDCDQVVFLDSASRRYFEELGGMNLVFVRSDDTLVTPTLTGTILPGITRDAVMTIASSLGLGVEERQIGVDDLFEGTKTGLYREAFACGTAAVVSPIGRIKRRDKTITFGDGETAGRITSTILSALTDIQYGRKPDPYGWVKTLYRV